MPTKELKEFCVIRKVKTSDESLIVKALCRDDIVRSFIIKGVHKNKANILLSHFSFVEATITTSKFSTTGQASKIATTLPLKNVRTNLNKNLQCLYLSDLLDKVLKDGNKEDGMFLWIKSQAELLDNLEKGFNNFHLCFVRDLCARLGYELTLESFLPFIKERPNTRNVLEFIAAPYEKAMIYPFSGKSRTAFCHDVQKYLSAHIDAPIVCPSLDIIASLY